MKTSVILLALAALTTCTNGQFPQKYVKQGIPKLFVLPTNPFIVPQVSVETPTLEIDFTKFTANGMDQFELKDLNIDLDNNIFKIDVNMKWAEASALYKFNGKLLGIQLNAQGEAYANITDLDIKMSLRGTRSVRNGKTYINFDDKKIKIAFDKCFIFYDDLFPSPELTEVTNRVFNSNIKEVIYQLQPIIDETVAAVISNSIIKLFEKYSVDELFPL